MRQLDVLLGSLESGDALIASALSRRSQRRFTIDRCPRFAVTSHGTLFNLFAEIERALLSLRTKEALAAVRAAGKRLGRPPGARGQSKPDGKEQEIQTLLALQVSKASIAKITGVDRSTLYHFIRARGLMQK